MSKLKNLKNALKNKKHILLASHIDPDGDTIGSMLALYLILKKLGKKATLFAPDPIPDIYKFLPYSEKVSHQICIADFDLVIALDAGSPGRLGKLLGKAEKQKIINIDHHSDNTHYGNINYIKEVSSTGEIIYNLALYLGIAIDKEIATCLYVAIMTDTGNFKYENTSAQTFAVAKALIDAGVSPDETANAVYENRTWSSLKILAKILDVAQLGCQGKLIYSVITEKMMRAAGARNQDLTGVIDHLRSIKGVEVAMLIRQDKEPSKIKINLRAKSHVNVQKIAKKLGGGGHPRAAGAIVSGTLKTVTQRTIKIIKASLC